MPMTSIIATTSDANVGRCIVRPRRALNHCIRPRTAKANGVHASATSAAVTDSVHSGSLHKASRHFASMAIRSNSSCVRHRTPETQHLQQRFDPEPVIIAVGDSASAML